MDHEVVVSLPFRAPLDLAGLLAWLGARALPGVEELTPDGGYRRTLSLPGGPAVLALHLVGDAAQLRATLSDHADLDTAIELSRRALDLDADPEAVDAHLARDELLAPRVRASPGRRVPGHMDPFELAVRAIVGQQVSVAGARTIAGRMVAEHGRALASPDGVLTHLFPTPAAFAAIDPETLPMPRARGRALNALGAAVARGDLLLDPHDPTATRAGLLALPGIGPWTADYVALRALGDPDVWLPTDLGVKRGLAAMGAPPDRAERWRPFRSYALMHTWDAGF